MRKFKYYVHKVLSNKSNFQYTSIKVVEKISKQYSFILLDLRFWHLIEKNPKQRRGWGRMCYIHYTVVCLL